MAQYSRTCKNCSEVFELRTLDYEFYEKVSPLVAQVKCTIPPPSLCPDCRKQRRLSYRNDYALYRRTCDASHKDMISIYPSSVPFPVYERDVWWSERWDPLSFGRDCDFSQLFFEQFRQLRDEVPRLNVYVDNLCENCNYSNQLTSSKNCYLVVSGSTDENCYYGYRINNSRACVDCLFAVECELCYQCVDAVSSYNCRFSRRISNCSDSLFLLDCQACQYCLFCVGLRNKSYCIFNIQYSKAEFADKISQYDFTSRSLVQHYQRDFEDFSLKYPRKFAHLRNVDNVTGNNVQHAKNCSNVFDGQNLEDVHYSQYVQDVKDCMDLNYGCDHTTLHYEVCTSGIEAYNVLFSIDTWPVVSNLLYCDSCSNGTRDCFGCIGLRGRQYCILNRQYSKSAYENLLLKVIEYMRNTGEWGEFFPHALSPFPYNDSTAQDYFPLTKKSASASGLSWALPIEPHLETPLVPTADSLRDIPDDITRSSLKCANCSKRYRILAQELDFYRTMQVPVPDSCFVCRHRARMKLRSTPKLWERTCDRCNCAVSSTYAPDSRKCVYCEACYLSEVY